MATALQPKKNEKRSTFLNRDGDPQVWRLNNSFTFEFEAPDALTALLENKGDSLSVLLAGDIMDIEAASEFVSLLAENPEADIDMKINSAGGSVDQGMMMFNAMKEHQGRITTTITGQAASTALTIAMGGDVIRAHENTTLMMHPAHAHALLTFTGGSEDGIGMANFVQEMADKATTQIVDLLAIRSGQAKSKVEKMVNANAGSGTTLTAKEAKELGFVDELIANEPRSKNLDSHKLTFQSWQHQHLANSKRLTLAMAK